MDEQRANVFTIACDAPFLDVLAKDGLVKIDKAFVANRPQTTCRVTAAGRKRFREYLGQLEKVLRDAHAEEPAPKPSRGPGWAPA